MGKIFRGLSVFKKDRSQGFLWKCNNTLKLCVITFYLRWSVNEVLQAPCICWRVHVWDHVLRRALSLLKPPDADGQAKHFCHNEFPSPACTPTHPCLAHACVCTQMAHLHAFFFFLIKFLLAELIILHSCSYLGDISHITGIALGLHSHVGTNQRCNISAAMAFQQDALSFLQSAWSEVLLLLG